MHAPCFALSACPDCEKSGTVRVISSQDPNSVLSVVTKEGGTEKNSQIVITIVTFINFIFYARLNLQVDLT